MMTGTDPITLVLVGPMGAGKTSVGKRIARELAVPFVDTDKRIVSAHGPIPDIFERHGEPHFRDLERTAVADALLDADTDGGVISLGGGAVTDARTRERLRAYAVVFLTVSREAVAERIRGDNRPLLRGEDDPVERWARIFEERRSWYDEVSDVVFDTSRRPMHRIAEEIVAWRREQQ
ncbi:MAG: shikimate kinase [Actinomycetota bacterium]